MNETSRDKVIVLGDAKAEMNEANTINGHTTAGIIGFTTSAEMDSGLKN